MKEEPTATNLTEDEKERLDILESIANDNDDEPERGTEDEMSDLGGAFKEIQAMPDGPPKTKLGAAYEKAYAAAKRRFDKGCRGE
jgi:hypothetical protein